MTFEHRRNRLRTHFSERVPVVKQSMIVKRKSHPQVCQLGLNLRPESRQLPHQIQLPSTDGPRTDVLNSSCRCCGTPDLLRVPSTSSWGRVLNR